MLLLGCKAQQKHMLLVLRAQQKHALLVLRIQQKHALLVLRAKKEEAYFQQNLMILTISLRYTWNPILHTRISVLLRAPPSLMLRLAPLKSGGGWTGELWSKTNLLNWQK